MAIYSNESYDELYNYYFETRDAIIDKMVADEEYFKRVTETNVMGNATRKNANITPMFTDSQRERYIKELKDSGLIAKNANASATKETVKLPLGGDYLFILESIEKYQKEEDLQLFKSYIDTDSTFKEIFEYECSGFARHIIHNRRMETQECLMSEEALKKYNAISIEEEGRLKGEMGAIYFTVEKSLGIKTQLNEREQKRIDEIVALGPKFKEYNERLKKDFTRLVNIFSQKNPRS